MFKNGNVQRNLLSLFHAIPDCSFDGTLYNIFKYI